MFVQGVTLNRKDSAVRVSLSFYSLVKQPHPKMSSDAQPTKSFRLTRVRQFSARRYPETFHRPATKGQRRRVWGVYSRVGFHLSTQRVEFFCKRFTNPTYGTEIYNKIAWFYACYFSREVALPPPLTGPPPCPCRILTEKGGRNRSGD